MTNELLPKKTAVSGQVLTKLHNLGWSPSDYRYGEPSQFSEWDEERLHDAKIDEAWYYYLTGSYEGHGKILLRQGDRWDYHDCGHCSCYGPIENMDSELSFASLDSLRTACTGELLRELAPLIEWAETRKKPKEPKR